MSCFEEVVYTPASLIKQPVRLFKEMWHDVHASKELAWRLMIRDISAQYRQSLLGIFWAFIPPIITAIALTLANNAKVINVGVTDMVYPAYVILSMTLWKTFVESLNGPILAIKKSKVMLTKIKIPPEAIILAELGVLFFNFAIKLLLIIGVFFWFNISYTWTIIFAPISLMFLIMLGLWIGLLLAPLSGLYHDVSRVVGLVTTAWMFLTPVIYPVPQTGIFSTIVRFNPVTPLLVTTRELATIGTISHPFGLFIASLLSGGGLLLGWIFYRLAMPFVVERFSA